MAPSLSPAAQYPSGDGLARRAAPVIVVLAAAAGIGAVVARLSPTGRPVVDAVLVGISAAAVTAVAGRAPAWTVMLASAAAAAIAVDPVLIGLAVVALGLALWARRNDLARVAAMGLCVNVLARAELDVAFGVSAVVALVACALVFVTGLRRQDRAVRRVAWVTLGVGALFGLMSTLAFGVAAFQARHSLSEGLNHGEEAVASLEYGDYESAADEFGAAAVALDRAHAELTSPLAFGARFVPVVAQHYDASIDMSASGAEGADVAADALDDVDLDALRVAGGRIDVAAVTALDEPLRRVEGALDDLDETVDESMSPWLIGRAAYEMRDFQSSIAEHMPQLEEARDIIAVAPRLLGAEGPRTYLVLFWSPSELRHGGGAVGNVAELRVDDGVLSLARFRRAEGLRDVMSSPSFPVVGASAAEIYEQETGRAVDGVIAADPYVLAAVLGYTGPIQLSTFDQQLDTDNAAWFLVRDQYLAATGGERIDALDEAAALTMEALLSSTLPDPTDLARDLGPLVADRRLMLWDSDPELESLLEDVGLAGTIPEPAGRDGWGVTLSNAGNNEIDSFLTTEVDYDEGTLTVHLTNGAPPDGLPAAVIGNDLGLPPGTSRLAVDVHTPLSLVRATLDGAPVDLAAGADLGWNVYSTDVDIPPGGTVTLLVELEGRVDPGEPVTWEQPLVE
jgi:hypothetical protein